jgi:hypothetical protein
MSGIFILNYPPPKFFIISHINYGIIPVDIFQVEVLYTLGMAVLPCSADKKADSRLFAA